MIFVVSVDCDLICWNERDFKRARFEGAIGCSSFVYSDETVQTLSSGGEDGCVDDMDIVLVR